MSPSLPLDDSEPVKVLDADRWTAQMVANGYTSRAAQARAIPCSRNYLYLMLDGKVEPHTRIARRMLQVSNLKPSEAFRLAAA